MKQLTEPKVEFIELSADVIATSGSIGGGECPEKCPNVCNNYCTVDGGSSKSQ